MDRARLHWDRLILSDGDDRYVTKIMCYRCTDPNPRRRSYIKPSKLNDIDVCVDCNEIVCSKCRRLNKTRTKSKCNICLIKKQSI